MKALFIFLTCLFALKADSHAQDHTQFLDRYCLDCHDSDTEKGGVNLENLDLDWNDPKSGFLMENVIHSIEDKYMPPAKKKKQPTEAERQQMIKWTKELLTKKIKPGGTALRRLSKFEYENSIHSLFHLPFKAPASFPTDATLYGFDNIADGMQLSPPLMMQYFEVATQVANSLLPPPIKKSSIKIETVRGKKTHRLTSSLNSIARSAESEGKFEALHTGLYKLVVKAKVFLKLDSFYAKHKNFTLQVISISETESPFQPIKPDYVLAEFKISPKKTHQIFNKTIKLEKGQTIGYFWKDGPLYSVGDEPVLAETAALKRFADPAFYTAWQAIESKRSLTSETMYQAFLKEKEAKKTRLLKPPSKVNLFERRELKKFMNGEFLVKGPAIDVKMVGIQGPLKLLKSKQDIVLETRTKNFMGERKDRSDAEWIKAILSPFIDRAFRRPLDNKDKERYFNIALKHNAAGHDIRASLHLAVRAVLCSPRFIYRNSTPGKLDSYDLATRLSYFLTSSPPGRKLMKQAKQGKLSDDKILEEETRRLLKSGKLNNFIKRFCGQWLGTEKLVGIMPDPRLRFFSDTHRNYYIQETEMFFKEILKNNLPMQTFIDPDFIFVNKMMAKEIYDMSGNDFTTEIAKHPIRKGTRLGGILTQASVMMATANGVDTQPVLRGVWLLENVLGKHLPSPPSDVPALDTSSDGTKKTIKQQVQAHTKDPGCASCHLKIDPLGFALENFDPIGRWRSHYPKYKERDDPEGNVQEPNRFITLKGDKVDSAGSMPDGTHFNDITDLKKYIVKNVDEFTCCIAEKLMTYATGRKMNFADKAIIKQAVQRVKVRGNGFQDLIIELVKTDSFKIK